MTLYHETDLFTAGKEYQAVRQEKTDGFKDVGIFKTVNWLAWPSLLLNDNLKLWLWLSRRNQINTWGRWRKDDDILSLVPLIKESGSVSCTLLFLRSSVCLQPEQWIYSWRWALYFSLHAWGCSRDILQPSHVPHKNCQRVRSEDFSKTTRALMHSNTLHYNDISHQQYEGERLTWRDGKRKDERGRSD